MSPVASLGAGGDFCGLGRRTLSRPGDARYRHRPGACSEINLGYRDPAAIEPSRFADRTWNL